MDPPRKTISLLCPKCNGRGKATWASDGDGPGDRHQGTERLSLGFRFVDRGEKDGAHFECSRCRVRAKEF